MYENMMSAVPVYTSVLQVFINGMSVLLNIIRIAGTGIAVVILTWMAFRYITASPENKGAIKNEGIKNYIIGFVVFVAGSNIVYYIVAFVNGLFTITE